MTDGRAIRTPMLLPPGYFRVTSNGRIHLVRSALRVQYPDGDAWISVTFWCSHITTDRRGTLLAEAPGGPTCTPCQERRFYNLPRVRS